MSKEVYDKEINGKNFDFILEPVLIKLRVVMTK